MNKSLIALALVSAFAAPAFAEEAAPAPALTGNIGLVSNYIFRGISQTQNHPAIQGGFDYNHASGFYVGTWASNVGWVTRSDYSAKDNNSMELDLYGGYKGSFATDFSYDVGMIKYYYPGTGIAGNPTPDTLEMYAGIGWKFITLKYNYTVSKYFVGWGDQDGEGKNNRGSGYIDLSANYDLGDGWGVQAHIGHQKVKSYSDASYTDWKLGVTKDVGFGVVGLAYTDTNANTCGDTVAAYCWNNKNVAKGNAVLSFTKSF
jgi:uncharacterized protein (TIGR02001 family)